MRHTDQPAPVSPAYLRSLRDGEYLAQEKRNGWRCLTRMERGTLTFTSRHGKPLEVSGALRELLRPRLEALPSPVLIDSEWMGRRAGQPEALVLFDLLELGPAGWLGQRGALERFRWLLRLADLAEPPMIVFPRFTLGEYPAFFEQSREWPGVEGIVLKRVDSPYVGSVRGCTVNGQWFKVRHTGGEDGMTRVA